MSVREKRERSHAGPVLPPVVGGNEVESLRGGAHLAVGFEFPDDFPERFGSEAKTLLDVFITGPAARDGKKARLPQGFKHSAAMARGVGLG